MPAKKAARKKVVARKHEVRAELSNVELVKARSSLKLTVYAKDEKLGEIQIGRGALYWWGKNRKNHKRIDWSRFAEMMDGLAYGTQSS
ncbi:MAG: hypothetical protein ACO1TE_18295 [Prosthecobacter sp.]